MVKVPDAGQEALFAINDQAGLIQERSFEPGNPEAPVNGLIERDILLLNALGYIAAARQLDGVKFQAEDREFIGRYGARVEAVVASSARKAGRLKHAASQAFIDAAGGSLVRGAEEPSPEQKRDLLNDFTAFYIEYGRKPDSRQKLVEYRHKLERNVRMLQDVQTQTNRSVGARPHKKVVTAKVDEETTSRFDEMPTPDTQARMHAIKGDIRAGFYPASNSEKNRVLAYLDYLDNPDYPLGINNQMFEVMAGIQKYRKAGPDGIQPKKWSAKDAQRAVESIVWEIADDYNSARFALIDLRALEGAIDGVSPRVSIGEIIRDELAGHASGFECLQRGIADFELAEKGKTAAPVTDPLAGTHVRLVSSSDRNPGRHKYTFNIFTRPDRATNSPELEKYLADQQEEMTVKEVRQWLPIILANEQKRFDFMRRRLEDVLQLSDKRSMAGAVAAARYTLGIDLEDQAA